MERAGEAGTFREAVITARRMNWPLLLEWMTHLGSGSYAAFREAIRELYVASHASRAEAESEELDMLTRNQRIALSDFGHADFFVGRTRRWIVRKPALMSVGEGDEHLFIGGRTASLKNLVAQVASRYGVPVGEIDVSGGLSKVSLRARLPTAQAIAHECGIEFVPGATALLESLSVPIAEKALRGAETPLPVNWIVRSWSFDREAWVADAHPRTVREYTNRHGMRRYLCDLGDKGWREMGRREAIYLSAWDRGRHIAHYSEDERVLRMPRWAPLPESYSRIACLAGGALAAIDGNSLVFHKISPRFGAALLVGLGQGFPRLAGLQ
jgi:hypothetical protein